MTEEMMLQETMKTLMMITYVALFLGVAMIFYFVALLRIEMDSIRRLDESIARNRNE